MNVLRILRLAESLYGKETRRRIFEPLAADLQRELAGPDGNPQLTLRWRVAVIAAFVQRTPRAFTNRMPRGVWSEVALCVIGFGAPLLAFIGWQLRNDERERISALAANPFIRIVMVGSTLMIASWPAKLALGVGIFDPRWNGDRFVSYLLAALVIVTMGRRMPEDYSPGTRRT